MSQAPHENIDVSNPAPTTGDPQHPPPSVQNQESRGTFDFVDSSGHLFSMYLEMATEVDKKMAENWKDDADGILIFTGLFSAAVASLISVSIQDLRPNPQDTSNFYLANMYRATIHPNESSSLPTSPPPFIPPNYAVWVNGLWFLSLVISITCALLATLLQQWARRYLKVTQPRYSLHKRARIRAFFAEGVEKFLLPWVVEALPAMLHLALFLFFAGLAVFLSNVNLTIFKLVLSWVGLCTALYGCITFIPVFHHDSPYHTPLSLLTCHFFTGMQFFTFRTLEWTTLSLDYFNQGTYDRFRLLAERYGRFLVQGMQKMAEESAYNSASEIDTRAFMWTFDSLDEDHKLEHFFAGLPGFRSSKIVKDPMPDLTSKQRERLLDALVGLADRTYSSELLPEHIKIRRTVICRKAIGPKDIPQAIQRIFHRIISEVEDGPVQSSAIAHLVRGWDDGKSQYPTTITQAIVSIVVARAPRQDHLWFAIAADEMGVPEALLHNDKTHGDNLSLAIFVHIIRVQFILFWNPYWPRDEFSKVLSAASKFDALNTSPELQHEFCALWNQIICADGWMMPSWILRPIRNIYLTLHLHTDSVPTAFSASTCEDNDILRQQNSYPLCNIPGHHPDSTPQIHDASTSLPISRADLCDNPAPLTPSIVNTPNSSFPSLTTSIHVDENALDVPPLDDMLVPALSSCAHQTPMENLRDFATSPDPAIVAATQDSYSARMSPTIRETSTSTTPAPPPAEDSFQNNVDVLAPQLGSQEISPSTYPELMLENILPTESHSSIIANPSRPTSPWPTSAPGLVAATSDEGSPKASSRENKNTLDHLPVDRASQAITQAIIDVLPQLLPLATVTDVVTASPSQQEFEEHARDPHNNTV